MLDFVTLKDTWIFTTDKTDELLPSFYHSCYDRGIPFDTRVGQMDQI